ncbi:hypothetical protein R3P38DRAFT_3325584 [Favolaschia claudopus]|uniref:Uncharacterized protein n=1 Tax=Favolaschia claudopus TaxID=2862362 RepID=A0AAW0AFJ7_9AGAR
MDVDYDASDDVDLGVSEPEEGPVPVESTALLPEKFIYVRHHRNAEKPLPEIIPLESSPEAQVPSHHGTPRHPGDRPFAPFRTFADYKFASRCIKRRMPKHDIDEDLRDMHGGVYSTDSFVTFRNHRDLNRSLVSARLTNVAFETESFVVDFKGKRYNIDVEFRDPWKLMKRWICDESLAAVSTWYSQQKFLCLNGEIDFSNPLYDEPWTGTMWREIDDQLPEKAKYPPCFVGLHIWLDKGLVSTKVKMHPILVRGCWIESATRNGSGNGGGTLAGFVRMPPELREIDPKTLSGSLRSEYDQLKRQIYHAVCRLILSSLQKRSLGGETLKFGDGVLRTAYPGILIESMDFEEIAAWLAIRNSRALHPCPQCLVHKDDLHRLSQVYPARTAVSMKRVLTDAPRGPKTAREEYLREYGLHDFVHFLWEFAHSELYKAVGFDKLHFFDGGEFGRHAWVLLKEYLQNHQLASTFNQWMDQFPRWRNLKHIFGATNISYSEGQTFVDILKCVLPCIVQLVPTNSWLVQWMRALQKIQAMLALEVTTKSRLQYLRELQIEYEACCEKISEKHGKSFNYLKHHFLSHAIENFMGKGTSRNQNTRVGEGFQQEVSEMYQITNGKNAEHQIALIDENEEAMARLDMQVAMWQKSQEDAGDDLIPPPAPQSFVHWSLGAPERRISPISLESKQGNNPLFRNFNMNLRQYLARHHPAYPLRMEQDFEIMPCKALYVNFQSSVNWKSERDILRCNPSFHNEPRYDSVIFNAEDDPLAMAELALVFRCFLPDGVKLGLAMVRPFRRSSWHPKTRTDCPIRERKSGVMFIALEHVVRGVLLCPIFGASREAFYVIDTIDGDMFLRINGIDSIPHNPGRRLSWNNRDYMP